MNEAEGVEAIRTALKLCMKDKKHFLVLYRATVVGACLAPEVWKQVTPAHGRHAWPDLNTHKSPERT